MAKKIGKYYITLNNPRELLLQIKELKDNWNELEEWVKQEIYDYYNDIVIKISNRPNTLQDVAKKMQEIKEGKNEC